MPDDGVWQGVYGMSGPNSEIAMDPDMLFWTGCIDMMFTSTVILQLAEEGKLSLTDSLYKWLPTYTNIDSTITIRQLLNHTNGLYRWHFNVDDPAHDSVKANPYTYWDLEEFLLKFIVNNPPQFLPGSSWDFHETDYILLNMIIEEVTDSDPWLQYRDRIGLPLGLNDTYFIWSDTISAVIADPSENWPDFYKTAAWSIGGRRIIATPLDIARFAGKLFDGQLLSQTSLEQMSAFMNMVYYLYPILDGYGLGLCRFDLADHETWGHWGHDPGYSSAVIYWPEKNISFAFFSNSWGMMSQTNDICVDLFKIALRRYEFPFDKVHPRDVIISDAFCEPSVDNLMITSSVYNPDSHDIQVKAMVSDREGSLIDSTIMNDAGSDGDMLAGDGIYSCSVGPISREDNFIVAPKTIDLNTQYNHTLPEDSAALFTTIGALEISEFYPTQKWGTDSLSGPGHSLFYRISVYNQGKETTAKDVTVKIFAADSLLEIGTTKTITFGDIEAGETAPSTYEFFVKCAQECPLAAQLPLRFEIYSEDYHYWTDTRPTDIYTGINNKSETLPLKFALFQNYPNPFNPLTTITYQLPMSSDIKLSIYNILGEKVVTLVSKKQQAGKYTVEWNASGFASGVYIYRLSTDQGFAESKKLLLIK